MTAHRAGLIGARGNVQGGGMSCERTTGACSRCSFSSAASCECAANDMISACHSHHCAHRTARTHQERAHVCGYRSGNARVQVGARSISVGR
eukprot:1901510-Pleurochrysis_carterae.AAC.5